MSYLLCGIVLVGQALPGEDALTRLAHVGVPYYYDYTSTTSAPANYEKVPMARLGEDPAKIALTAQAHPGRTWLIGNEPDQPDQDGHPDAVAEMETLMRSIKATDPTATLVGPNILSTSSLDPYRHLPFDIWGVHVYVPEEQLPHALDGWPHPLWVTEFGTGSADPVGYVRKAVASFKAAGALKWFLFSSDPIPAAWGRSSGNWITSYARADGELTQTGTLYREVCQ